MDKFNSVAAEMLFKRLDEIDGELQDFHISAYKSELLYKEQREIEEEVCKRGWYKVEEK